ASNRAGFDPAQADFSKMGATRPRARSESPSVMRYASRMRITLVIASGLLFAGCGGKVIFVEGSGGGDASSTHATGTGNASTGTGSGAFCGLGTPCKADEYCDYPDNRCGFGVLGACKPSPAGCDKNFVATCACDGLVHENDCEANKAH